MRPIDADELLNGGIRVSRGFNDDGVVMIPMKDVRQSIKDAPTIKSAYGLCGQWEKYDDSEYCYCSACGKPAATDTSVQWSRFCPICGAKMEREVKMDLT